MNCFEARQDFPAFWRRSLASERRAELLAHLKSCAKCDRAFRTFALTAPVLYSAVEPQSRTTARPIARDARRTAAATRAGTDARRWFAMCASVTVIAAASFAAYLSVTAPVESLTDEFADNETAVQLFEQDLPGSNNDFGG